MAVMHIIPWLPTALVTGKEEEAEVFSACVKFHEVLRLAKTLIMIPAIILRRIRSCIVSHSLSMSHIRATGHGASFTVPCSRALSVNQPRAVRLPFFNLNNKVCNYKLALFCLQ